MGKDVGGRTMLPFPRDPALKLLLYLVAMTIFRESESNTQKVEWLRIVHPFLPCFRASSSIRRSSCTHRSASYPDIDVAISTSALGMELVYVPFRLLTLVIIRGINEVS